MLVILTKIPFYVWPLLAGLIFSGIKATKTGVIPLKIFWALPTFFFLLSGYSVISRYGITVITFLCWLIPLFIGILIGLQIGSRLKLRFDKKNKRVEMPGSWFTLILALSIFCSKFFIRISSLLHPEWIGRSILLAPEIFAALACGTFIGRSIILFKKYNTASHVNLT
jgi:hypothetical protein